MGADKRLDLTGNTVFLRKRKAVVNVTDYIYCAFLVGLALMVGCGLRDGALILNEAHGILHLSEVVIKRRGAEKLDVRIRCAAHGVYHIHHLEAVLEGSGSLCGEFLKERIGGIGQFYEPCDGHKVENLLEEINQRIQGNRCDGADENEDHVHPPGGVASHIYETECQEDKGLHAEDDGGVEELPPPLAEVAEGFKRDSARHQIHHKEFHPVSAENKERQKEHHIERHHQPLAEKRQQIKGKNGIRDDVLEVRYRFLADKRYGRYKKEYCKKVVIPLAVLEYKAVGEIHHQIQDHHKRKGKEEISQVQEHSGAAVAVNLVVFLLVTVKDLGYLRGDDFPAGDNLFIGLDIPQGGRNIV